MLYRFHANLFARPDGLHEGTPLHLRDKPLKPLRTEEGRPPIFDAFFSTTFEQALTALARLPRLDAEPDGFFVIAGDYQGKRWQIDGHLFDFNDRLHRVELHGECPAGAFDSLLACFGWPATPLAFELVQEGVALDEIAFRTWACA
jgi:hypothetical protein